MDLEFSIWMPGATPLGSSPYNLAMFIPHQGLQLYVPPFPFRLLPDMDFSKWDPFQERFDRLRKELFAKIDAYGNDTISYFIDSTVTLDKYGQILNIENNHDRGTYSYRGDTSSEILPGI